MKKEINKQNNAETQIGYDTLLATVIGGGLTGAELSELRKAVVKQETEIYHKERKLIYEIEMNDDFAHCFKHQKDAIEYLTTDMVEHPGNYFNEEAVRLRKRWLDLEAYNTHGNSWLEA